MSNDDVQIAKLRGILIYPKLFLPDTKYTPKWTLDLLLNAAGLKEAKEMGLRIRKDREKDGKKVVPYAGMFEGYDGSYIRVERPTKNRKGEDNERPVVKDASGKRDVPTDTPVGTGTEAIVRFLVKTRDMDGKEMSMATAMKKNGGYGTYLTGVQILNLVRFERSSDPDTDFVEEEGSFVVPESGGRSKPPMDWDKGDDLPFEDMTAAG